MQLEGMIIVLLLYIWKVVIEITENELIQILKNTVYNLLVGTSGPKDEAEVLYSS
jgi:hypothetical protein